MDKNLILNIVKKVIGTKGIKLTFVEIFNLKNPSDETSTYNNESFVKYKRKNNEVIISNGEITKCEYKFSLSKVGSIDIRSNEMLFYLLDDNLTVVRIRPDREED